MLWQHTYRKPTVAKTITNQTTQLGDDNMVKPYSWETAKVCLERK